MNISSNPGGGEVSEKAGKGLQTFGKGLAKKISEANAAAGSFAEGGDVMAAGAKGKSWKQMKWTDSPPWLSKDKVYEEFTPDVLRQLKESGDEGKFRHWGDLSNYNSMILDEIDEKKKGEKKPPIIFPLKKEVEEVPEMLKRNPTPKGEMLNAAQGGKVNAAMGRLQKMDNKKNDVVPAMLSPGEIVIPRSIVNSPNPPAAAAEFVQALLANKDKKNAKIDALKVALRKK